MVRPRSLPSGSRSASQGIIRPRPPEPPAIAIDPRSALANRGYLLYLVGNAVSLHGLWIYRVALGWHAWTLSGSELWVGIVAATQFAPAVVFGPVFGVLADRFDRRAASILINAVSILNMFVLGLLAALGVMDVRVLTLLALMQGVLDGAHAPVRMSLVPNLVSRPQLESAIALTSVSFNLSRFIGPALAGLIIAASGVATAYIVNGVSYIALIVALLLVRLQPSGNAPTTRKHPWEELKDGARYVVRHRTIRGLLVIAALSSVFGRGALEMLPAFADDVFSRGASGLAALTSAIGAGAVVTGLLLARSPAWLGVGAIRASLLLAGCLVIAFGANESFAVAIGLVALLGVTLSFCGIGSQILIQTLVDDDVRGRVSSFWGMIAFGGTSLGSLIAGTTAHFTGLHPAIVGMGSVCLGLTLLSALRQHLPPP